MARRLHSSPTAASTTSATLPGSETVHAAADPLYSTPNPDRSPVSSRPS